MPLRPPELEFYNNVAVVSVVLIAAAVLLVIIFCVVSVLRASKRRKAIADLAARLGLSFSHGRDNEHDDRYAQFEVFRRGTARYAFNTVSGEIELGGHRMFTVFGDFHYAVHRNFGEDKHKKSYRFSYLIVQMPWANVPNLLVRPEGVLDRLGALVGFEDINFESAEFSRAFFVSSSDRKFAYDLIDQRMMLFLLETRPPMIDLENGSICISHLKRKWPVEEFDRELKWVEGFFSRWPKHVIKRIESESS